MNAATAVEGVGKGAAEEGLAMDPLETEAKWTAGLADNLDAISMHKAEDPNAFEQVGPIAAAARAAAAKTQANPVVAGGTAGLTGGARAAAAKRADDGGLGVVRIKPLGVGMSDKGSGASYSALNAAPVSFSTESNDITVAGAEFTYPSHVIPPTMDNEALYEGFMPPRVQAFLDGINVNVMAYGQTGSGKTHSMFGPPGMMGRASTGEYGNDVCAEYGPLPRGALQIVEAVEGMRAAGVHAVLTASAVELSMMGNRDMLIDEAAIVYDPSAPKWGGAQAGVALDKREKPPRLYGMTELVLDSKETLRHLYAGLATRNTQATMMNDSSSRSHCFVILTLRTRDAAADTISTSRFQFVDLAGSERLKDAHGEAGIDWKNGATEAINGLMTNYSLTMLSQCARQLVETRRKGGAKAVKAFSWRAFIGDLVPLLSESMTGDAATACFVCLSQAPDNLTQSRYALEFGEVFAKLVTQPRQVPPVARRKIEKDATALLKEASQVLSTPMGGGKFKSMRQAQKYDCQQTLALMKRLADAV